MPAPTINLSPEQQAVIDHRAGHLQVIACAGSGKTESISRRVARLIKEGALPESIVAFTFTERAAGDPRDEALLAPRRRWLQLRPRSHRDHRAEPAPATEDPHGAHAMPRSAAVAA